MKPQPQHLLLVLSLVLNADALSFLSKASIPSASLRSTVGQLLVSQKCSSRASLKMDVEGDLSSRTIKSISRKIAKANPSISRPPPSPWTDNYIKTPSVETPGESAPSSSLSVDEMESTHGMPWNDTIGVSKYSDPLLFMPFWEWQLEHMKNNLTNLTPDETSLADFGFMHNEEKKARVINQCYKSDEYRKIRMTYYDAGDKIQVFNSLWYPHERYNLPVLGIDLLSFGRKKFLVVVDFQPIHMNESDHASQYEHRLKPIKNMYDSLKGRMSSKFYDETQFFSQEMLFARFTDESVVTGDLFPAFQRYVHLHNEIVSETPTDESIEGCQAILERQSAYDTYSAERDPATKLFEAMFGKEWAEDFVYNFLFSLSERIEPDGGASRTSGK